MPTTITSSYDNNQYMEDFKYGEAIAVGVKETSWLIDGVNYVEHTGTQTGTVTIPTGSTRGNTATRTPLCTGGATDIIEEGSVTVTVDGKFSHKFNGCFAATGIANISQLRLRNKLGMQIIREGRELDMYDILATNSIAATSDYGDAQYLGKPNDYLVDIGKDFFQAYGIYPTAAVVTPSFFADLTKQLANRQTQMGDNFITGERRMTIFASGMTVIPYNRATEEVIVSVPEALHEYVPGNATQIGELASLVDTPALANVSYSGGFLTKHDVNPGAVSVYTWVHYINGRVAIPDHSMKSVVTVTP